MLNKEIEYILSGRILSLQEQRREIMSNATEGEAPNLDEINLQIRETNSIRNLLTKRDPDTTEARLVYIQRYSRHYGVVIKTATQRKKTK